MICEPCTVAGDVALMWRGGNRQQALSAGRITDLVDLHGKCRRGTWCDCQHEPGPVVR